MVSLSLLAQTHTHTYIYNNIQTCTHIQTHTSTKVHTRLAVDIIVVKVHSEYARTPCNTHTETTAHTHTDIYTYTYVFCCWDRRCARAQRRSRVAAWRTRGGRGSCSNAQSLRANLSNNTVRNSWEFESKKTHKGVHEYINEERKNGMWEHT